MEAVPQIVPIHSLPQAGIPSMAVPLLILSVAMMDSAVNLLQLVPIPSLILIVVEVRRSSARLVPVLCRVFNVLLCTHALQAMFGVATEPADWIGSMPVEIQMEIPRVL